MSNVTSGSVDLARFAASYNRVWRAGGTRLDVQKELGIDRQEFNRLIAELRAELETADRTLPSLKRATKRTRRAADPAQRAALVEMFASDESDSDESDSDES